MVVRLQAALRRLPAEAVFSGLTAAWIHGLDVDPGERIEVTIPKSLGVTTRSGMIVRRSALAGTEVVKRRGFPVTSALRTLLDVSCRLSLTEAVVIADMALHAKLIHSEAMRKSIQSYEGVWGVKRLRRVALHAEPASESPMETRLRMLLVLARLPRPRAQVPIHDRSGRFLGRPDLYYPDVRLAIEYDGGTHRSTLVQDNRRQNRLVDAGIHLLRFTASDIYSSPESVIALVRGRLTESVHTSVKPAV
jgi:very-short-patch-repair endonuclease